MLRGACISLCASHGRDHAGTDKRCVSCAITKAGVGFQCVLQFLTHLLPRHSHTTATAAGLEEKERLEHLIVKDFKNDAKGHKERLMQGHRVRERLEELQSQAAKLVRSD